MKRMTVVFVALVFALVSVGTVYAHQRRGGRGGEGWEKGFGLARLADKLDLSSEQKRQVASILESHRMEIGAVANQLADATDGLMSRSGPRNSPKAP